jgi:hypothetical protein
LPADRIAVAIGAAVAAAVAAAATADADAGAAEHTTSMAAHATEATARLSEYMVGELV